MLSVHSLHLTPVQKKLKKTVSFQRMKLINCGFYTRDSQQPKQFGRPIPPLGSIHLEGRARDGEKNSLFFSTTSTENHSMMFGDVFKKSSFFFYFFQESITSFYNCHDLFITILPFLIYIIFFQYTREYALFFKTFFFFVVVLSLLFPTS